MTGSPRRGFVQSASKSILMSFSKPSNIAFGSAFFMVAAVVCWRDFLIEQGPSVYSTLTSAMEAPGATTPPTEQPVQPPVRSLLEALRKAVRKVEQNTGVSSSDSDFDLGSWRRKNPCMSRNELVSVYSRLRDSPNRKILPKSDVRQWEAVFREYEKLHRVCIRAAGNLTEYFSARNTSTGCKFMVADAANGMGNKIFIMAPAVLYSILTQRVILLPASTGVPDLMCEPFAGSTWRLSNDIQRNGSLWNQTNEFMDNVDRSKREHESTLPIYASRVDDHWQPTSRFFCDVEQSYFGQVPWLTVHGCLYFLPKLFAISSLQTTLEALFSDPSLALTQVLRTAFLPRDQTWARVRTAAQLYTDGAHTQVGIQARYFNNSKGKHKVINSNVESCMLENNLLERAIPEHRRHHTTIFIASLTSDLQQHLNGVYSRTTSSFPNLTFHQLSNETCQRFGPKVYDQVLVEVLHLSLSHTLLVSPQSTFGGLSQAYGALIPWFIDSRDDVTTPCQYAQTVDNCYQMPDHTYHCHYDSKDKMGKFISDVVDYIKPCLAIDNGGGLQLVGGLHNNISKHATR